MESNFVFFSILAIVAFVAVVCLLAAVVLLARRFLVSAGVVNISVNEDKVSGKPACQLHVNVGTKLTEALSNNNIFLSTACGGRGTCGQCRAIVHEGGGSILPVEEPHFTKPQIREGWRLACQVVVKQPMKIHLDDSVMDVGCWDCEVVSNRNVATFIKELVLKLPEGVDVNFRAGGYVQFEIPPHHLYFKDFDVEECYRGDWNHFHLWDLESKSDVSVIRAYSMANYPAEKGLLKFNIRIATPPKEGVPPGLMSSYVFSLKPGDKMKVFGPYGEFFACETDKEKVYIGGGAGMAPLRSHIFDLLKTKHITSKISYWYGARSLRELFYGDEFEALAEKNPNFSWHVALSDPHPEDNWTGDTGFIHSVIYNKYLKNHPHPEECEYYLCGPPMMNSAVVNMLEQIGVEKRNILYDDFGV